LRYSGPYAELAGHPVVVLPSAHRALCSGAATGAGICARCGAGRGTQAQRKPRHASRRQGYRRRTRRASHRVACRHERRRSRSQPAGNADQVAADGKVRRCRRPGVPQPARGKARCQADTRATAHYRGTCAAPHCRGTHDATHCRGTHDATHCRGTRAGQRGRPQLALDRRQPDGARAGGHLVVESPQEPARSGCPRSQAGRKGQGRGSAQSGRPDAEIFRLPAAAN
jgi:hypothetical protein